MPKYERRFNLEIYFRVLTTGGIIILLELCCVMLTIYEDCAWSGGWSIVEKRIPRLWVPNASKNKFLFIRQLHDGMNR